MHLAHVVHAAYGIKVVIELLCCTIISAGYAHPVFNMRKDILNFILLLEWALLYAFFVFESSLFLVFLYGTLSSV